MANLNAASACGSLVDGEWFAHCGECHQSMLNRCYVSANKYLQLVCSYLQTRLASFARLHSQRSPQVVAHWRLPSEVAPDHHFSQLSHGW